MGSSLFFCFSLFSPSFIRPHLSFLDNCIRCVSVVPILFATQPSRVLDKAVIWPEYGSLTPSFPHLLAHFIMYPAISYIRCFLFVLIPTSFVAIYYMHCSLYRIITQ